MSQQQINANFMNNLRGEKNEVPLYLVSLGQRQTTQRPSTDPPAEETEYSSIYHYYTLYRLLQLCRRTRIRVTVRTARSSKNTWNK